MGDSQQVIFLVIGLALLIAMMFWPQWQARRRQQRQMAELQVGRDVMTAGGIIGKLVRLDPEANEAAIEIAPGVVIRIIPAAISRALPSAEAVNEDEENNEQTDDDTPVDDAR
ncbi:MAG: preprotein translocase subunit YajC [Anaerolineales bacterium]|nr:preprotein translocase subunit YajC [Anaerolineales bacterium]